MAGSCGAGAGRGRTASPRPRSARSCSARRSGWSRPTPGQRLRGLALEHDVGLGHEPAEVVGPRVGGEVEHDAALGRVVVPPPEAALGVVDVVGEGSVGAAGVTARRLDHDHVGAEVAEQLARRTPRAPTPARRRAARPAPRSRDAVLRQLLDLGRRRDPRSSDSTWWLCSPRHGPPRSICQSVSDRCTGMPSTRTSPISRWCAVGHRPHSLVPGSWSMRSSGRATAAAGTPAARSASAVANRSRVARPRAEALVERVLHRQAFGQRVVAGVGRPRLVDHRRRGWPSRRRRGTRWRSSCRLRQRGRCRAAHVRARGCGSSRAAPVARSGRPLTV